MRRRTRSPKERRAKVVDITLKQFKVVISLLSQPHVRDGRVYNLLDGTSPNKLSIKHL